MAWRLKSRAGHRHSEHYVPAGTPIVQFARTLPDIVQIELYLPVVESWLSRGACPEAKAPVEPDGAHVLHHHFYHPYFACAGEEAREASPCPSSCRIGAAQWPAWPGDAMKPVHSLLR